MIKFSVKKVDPDNLKRSLETLKPKIQRLRLAIGNTVAEELQKEVIKHIPSGKGWLDIYRKAIKVTFDGEEWAVAGEKEIPITSVDSNTTLLMFGRGDKASSILSDYNPWAVDLVPGISSAYTSKIVMKASSLGEVEIARSRNNLVLDDVKKRLASIGISTIPNELPKYNGKVVADLVYLAQRLEYGLGGFPRFPHWRPVTDNLSITLPKIIKSMRAKFEPILRGNAGPRVKPPSSELRQMLSSAVRKSPS